MTILVDMNLTPRWIAYFINSGIHAVHWSSIGAADAPEMEIMSHARDNNCIVFTHDLDFSAILAATGGQKPSVVQLRTDELPPEAIGDRTVAAIKQMASELDRGALLTIDNTRIRLRMLPF